MGNGRKGFTLVELSIVLVIIGLLAGGILIGRSMISTAKLQGTIRALGLYEAAVNNFLSTYRTYPGDSTYFTPAGDGDFWIRDGGLLCNGTLSNMENTQVFAHLSQANMVDKKYVSFSPGANAFGMTCNGPHKYNYFAESNADLIAPYTEISGEAAVVQRELNTSWINEEGGAGKKVPIQGGKSPTSNFYFYFMLNAMDIVALQSKLGPVPDSPNAVGMVDGNCYQPNGNSLGTLPCNEPDATHGFVKYYLAPI